VGGEIPIFHRNQGGIRRADAEVERAALQYLALRDRVEREVREARAQLEQASEALRRLRGEISPAAERALRLAEKAHAAGDISSLDVLVVRQPLLESRLREVEAEAACRRAIIELERSLGTRP
jgi:cobalt-zinc-cadmium efflux system outer membrane protein